MQPLYVVTAISNPCRWQSRERLYRDFAVRMANAGVQLLTVEMAYGERPHAATDGDHPWHLQLRGHTEIWHKEALLNLGVAHLSRLVPAWRYVAWIDAGVELLRPGWAAETVHALQHHPVVQCWSHAVDLGPDHSPLPNFYGTGLTPASWGYCHVHRLPAANVDLARQLAEGVMDRAATAYGMEGPGHYWHPGYAWACRRSAWETLGGLIDWSILGAADYLMAAALTGHLTLSGWLSAPYQRWVQQWRARAQRLQGDVGYVPGLLAHYWHGKKAQRGYKNRWRIFYDHSFDPEQDLVRDAQGLWQLTDRSPGLRDDLRAYFRARNEDSIDL